MVKEETVERACLSNDMKRLKVGNKPSWIDKSNKEGIDFDGYTVKGFINTGGERIYTTSNISDKINNLVNSLNNIPNEEVEKPQEMPKEDSPTNVFLPENITVNLLSNLEKIKPLDRLLLFQRTPKEFIHHKLKGKKQVPYVEGNTMLQEANVAFLFNWNDKIDGFHFSDKAVACYGSVTVIIDHSQITHSAVGIDTQEYTKEGNKPIFSDEELMKNAHTDMIKKALSKFGFNNDVYRGDV